MKAALMGWLQGCGVVAGGTRQPRSGLSPGFLQAQGSCQSELHRALERLAASQTRTHEDLYVIPIPNCDRNGNFHPKQVGRAGGCSAGGVLWSWEGWVGAGASMGATLGVLRGSLQKPPGWDAGAKATTRAPGLPRPALTRQPTGMGDTRGQAGRSSPKVSPLVSPGAGRAAGQVLVRGPQDGGEAAGLPGAEGGLGLSPAGGQHVSVTAAAPLRAVAGTPAGAA